jgi:hypothetical protein
MELLEDADGGVRDAAKSTVIELFRYNPHAQYSNEMPAYVEIQERTQYCQI